MVPADIEALATVSLRGRGAPGRGRGVPRAHRGRPSPGDDSRRPRRRSPARSPGSRVIAGPVVERAARARSLASAWSTSGSTRCPASSSWRSASSGRPSSVYALGYHDAGRSRLDTFAYVVFLASLGLVFGAANAFSFLFAWELMALSSAALVLGPAPDRSVARAGLHLPRDDPPRDRRDRGRLRDLVGGGGVARLRDLAARPAGRSAVRPATSSSCSSWSASARRPA